MQCTCQIPCSQNPPLRPSQCNPSLHFLSASRVRSPDVLEINEFDYKAFSQYFCLDAPEYPLVSFDLPIMGKTGSLISAFFLDDHCMRVLSGCMNKCWFPHLGKLIKESHDFCWASNICYPTWNISKLHEQMWLMKSVLGYQVLMRIWYCCTLFHGSFWAICYF